MLNPLGLDMQNYSSDKLFEKLQNEVFGKWHAEGRAGNDGNAGNTLEDLLGVSENNLKLPDWGNIELKTKRVETQSLVTLLHREPSPAASVPKLLLSLGWKHQNAGSKYGLDELSFRSTTRANSFSDRGFAVKLTDENIEFVFDKTKINFSAKDRTGIYANYGDWLTCVEARSLHYSDVLPVFWSRAYIEAEIKAKLDNTLLCLVKSKLIGGVKHFQYTSARLFSGFDPSKLDVLFNEHALYVDFDARTNHNHGTKFRVDLKSIGRLFDNTVEIF
jgi:hypothetical protein